MKISLQPGEFIHLEVEGGVEWALLQQMVLDARAYESELPVALTDNLCEETRKDWEEFVLPDLLEGFSQQLKFVVEEILASSRRANQGPGVVTISKTDAWNWYGALNQSRLALEAKHHFGPGVENSLAAIPECAQSAFGHSRFYSLLQSLLLENLMA